MPIEFALLAGDRYKIIIGMDILRERRMIVDLMAESLKFKLNDGDRINLKLVPRREVFRTKQLKAYRDYIRTIRSQKATANAAEEDSEDDELS